MPGYRLFCVDDYGRVVKRYDVVCADDAGAIECACEYSHESRIEVWLLDRRLAVIPQRTSQARRDG